MNSWEGVSPSLGTWWAEAAPTAPSGFGASQWEPQGHGHPARGRQNGHRGRSPWAPSGHSLASHELHQAGDPTWPCRRLSQGSRGCGVQGPRGQLSVEGRLPQGPGPGAGSGGSTVKEAPAAGPAGCSALGGRTEPV